MTMKEFIEDLYGAVGKYRYLFKDGTAKTYKITQTRVAYGGDVKVYVVDLKGDTNVFSAEKLYEEYSENVLGDLAV